MGFLYFLLMLFLGMMIGGFVAGNTTLGIISLILCFIDAGIGIWIQHNKDRNNDDIDWDQPSFEEKSKDARQHWEVAKQQMREQGIDVDQELEQFCDSFNQENKLGKYAEDSEENTDEEDEEMDLEQGDDKKTFLERDDTFKGMMGMPMNEKIFAELQSLYPYFDASVLLGRIKPLNLSQNGTGQLTWEESCMAIFGNIFGGYGCEKNLQQAYEMTVGLFDWLKNQKPIPDREDETYLAWLKQWGDLNILRGTICAYQKDYKEAAYYFINGLKTETVTLNAPYCDFIRYILGKLDGLPKSAVPFSDCGFSAEKPMGSTGGNILLANRAMEIISEMEGLNGEAVIAKAGRTGFFGRLQRKGSVSNRKGQIIDLYEVYIIDRKYCLYSAKLYFNGYFNGIGGAVKMASGFRLRENSLIKSRYTFIEESSEGKG